MTLLKIAMAVLGLMIGVLAAAPANAWTRGQVDVLAVLPDLPSPQPPGTKSSVEGLTVGPDGNIYVPTFGANTGGFFSSGTRECELRNLQWMVPTGRRCVFPRYFARVRSQLVNYQTFPSVVTPIF